MILDKGDVIMITMLIKQFVKLIIANGNFQCIYGERVYDSSDDLKTDLVIGGYELHPKY